MLRRVENDEPTRSLLGILGSAQSEPVIPNIPEAERETPVLPHDHPKWVKDALSVSQRARDAISRLRPAIITVLTFWDHRVRTIVIGASRISVDASGSYKQE